MRNTVPVFTIYNFSLKNQQEMQHVDIYRKEKRLIFATFYLISETLLISSILTNLSLNLYVPFSVFMVFISFTVTPASFFFALALSANVCCLAIFFLRFLWRQI